MSRFDKSLSSIFDVPLNADTREESFQVSPLTSISSTVTDDDVDDDAAFIKENLKTLISKGVSAFEVLDEIAKAEESPRSFEVLNSMLTTLSDLSMQLMTLHEKKAKIKQAAKKDQADTPAIVNNGTTNNTTNIAFVGTTADLQRMLKEKQLDHLRTLNSET